MTSKEFYALIHKTLAPECQRLGLLRSRGTTSLWFFPLSNGTFFYEIYKGPKRAYIPYLGGRFTVNCDITATANPKTRDFQTCLSYMQYFSSDDLDRMRIIHDGILEKIIAQKPASEFDRTMLELHTPSFRYSLGRTFRRDQLCELRYLDANDVLAWGQFLAAKLEETLREVREKPVFLLHSDNKGDSP